MVVSKFSSSTILRIAKLQFIGEVDGFEVRAKVVLSQCFLEDNKVHPCTYFFQKLLAAECNYNVLNKDAMKLALGE